MEVRIREGGGGKKWPAVILLVLLLSALFYKGAVELSSRGQQIDRLKNELAHVQIAQPIRVDTIRDSVLVVSAPVDEVSRSSYKKTADRTLLKDLDLTAGTVRDQSMTVSSVSDSVQLEKVSPDRYDYRDHWAEFHLSLRDSSLRYSVRDSVTTILYKGYRHRFLWWRWGVKSYRVKIVNFNPHSKIEYQQNITVD